MRFAQPALLWLLLALPVLALAGAWLSRRSRRALARFAGSPDHATRFTAEVSTHRRAVKALLLFLGLALAVTAAARPQWGSHLEPIVGRGVDVVVLLDHSLSMAAEDLAPSRLGHARRAIDSLLRRLDGNRVALVTFSGEAALQCPLTLDHAAVRLFLDTVDVQSVQVPGTALADALRLALATFGDREVGDEERGRAIVLFTDGEDHEGGVEKVLAEIENSGAAVFAVGCGTTRGAPIPLADSSTTTAGYKKDREGRVVTTRLDESLLELIALSASGRYYRATATEAEIEEISAAIESMEAREFGTTLRARYEERYQAPLVLAFLALAAEAWLSDRARRRGRGDRKRGES